MKRSGNWDRFDWIDEIEMRIELFKNVEKYQIDLCICNNGLYVIIRNIIIIFIYKICYPNLIF